MIISLKKGGDIHIKEKNKGKFTSYCGGKVTSACIAKAKASGNPTLIKRATFADNARKWKHQFGGPMQMMTKEDAEAINNREREMAKQYFSSTPTISNIWNGIKHAYNGWIDTQSHYNTGAPTILPGRVPGGLSIRNTKISKSLMNSNPITDEGSLQAAKDWLQMMGEQGIFPAKAPKVKTPKVTNVEVTTPVHTPPVKNEFTTNLIKAVERRQDNAIPVTRKLKTSIKHSQSFDDMDQRHILSGRKKFTKPQRERAQYLITNHYNSSSYGPWHKNLLNSYKKEAKIDRTDKKAWDKMMKARYEILDDFIKNSGLF